MEFLLGPYHGRLRNINENESERRTLTRVHFTTVSCYCVTLENRNMSQVPEHGCVKSQLSKFQGYYRTDNKTFLRTDTYKITCSTTLTYHPALLATARIFSTNQTRLKFVPRPLPNQRPHTKKVQLWLQHFTFPWLLRRQIFNFPHSN